MTTIVAGGFDVAPAADAAKLRLMGAGVRAENLSSFRVNPAGEHDVLPGGGDRAESPGTKHASSGAAKGAAVGAAVGVVAGVAASPVFGPVGVAVGAGAGAYAGSLVGALGRIDSEPQPDVRDVRPAETLIAVNAGAGDLPLEELIRLFEECGATQVERTEGRWENGAWADFDPLTAPQLIGGSDQRSGGAARR